MTSIRRKGHLAVAGVLLASVLAACGDDSSSSSSEAPATSGAAITLAVNPWTGSAVNAYVAKAVIEANLGSPVEIIDIDENATWVGLDDGSIDAVLEVWPSGHAADYETYITGTCPCQ